MFSKQKIRQKLAGSAHSQFAVIIAVSAAAVLLIASTTMEKKINIDDSGNIREIATYESDVKGCLSSLGININGKDKVTPELTAPIKDGMTVKIKRAVPVLVSVDGRDLVIETAENSVKDMFSTENIMLDEKDKVTPEISEPIKAGMKIKVVRVKEKIETNTETLAYKTVQKVDNGMEKGQTKVIQDGTDGEKEIQTKVVYEDGKEVSRAVISETVKKSPTDKIVSVGTLPWITVSRGGTDNKVLYTRKLKMKATSYTASYECTGKSPGDRGFGITATGTKARRDLHGYSTVAVDPNVIPLGTKLYVEGYGYAIAEDTGGAVRGNIIDLYFEPGSNEFKRWFTHNTTVYILK